MGEGIVVEFADKNAVLFGFDKADLTASTENSLNKLVAILKEYPDTNIEVQGHTDSRGTDEYNMQLSQRRATAVAGYLTRNGVGFRPCYYTKVMANQLPLQPMIQTKDVRRTAA